MGALSCAGSCWPLWLSPCVLAPAAPLAPNAFLSSSDLRAAACSPLAKVFRTGCGDSVNKACLPILKAGSAPGSFPRMEGVIGTDCPDVLRWRQEGAEKLPPDAELSRQQPAAAVSRGLTDDSTGCPSASVGRRASLGCLLTTSSQDTPLLGAWQNVLSPAVHCCRDPM